MNLLVIADSPPQQPIQSYLDQAQIDLIVTLGDLSLLDIRGLEDIHHIPKIGVYGNHDSGNYMETLGIKNLHLSTFELNGITFAGFEGCVRYKESEHAIMYTQEEANQLITQLPPAHVLLTHSPPFGIHDHDDPPHIGLHALNYYLDTHSPKYMLHGHTYPDKNDKRLQYKSTEIIYVYGAEIVELSF